MNRLTTSLLLLLIPAACCAQTFVAGVAVNGYSGSSTVSSQLTTIGGPSSNGKLNVNSNDLLYAEAELLTTQCSLVTGWTMTGSGGTTFTQIGTPFTNGHTNGCLVRWWASSTAAFSQEQYTVTITGGARQYLNLVVFQVTGAGANPVIEPTNGSCTNSPAGSATGMSCARLTTTAGDILITAGGYANANTTFTAGTCADGTCVVPTNGAVLAGTFNPSIVAYRLVATGGTNRTAAWTNTPASGIEMVADVFKPGAGGGGTPPVFTSANNASFVGGSASSFTVTASGNPAPVLSLFAGTLPPGITFTTATGVLGGTPTSVGISNLTFQASNASGSPTQAFTLTVTQPATAPVSCTGTYTNSTRVVTLNCPGSGLIPLPPMGFNNIAITVTLP
jgi:hypothetical protein